MKKIISLLCIVLGVSNMALAESVKITRPQTIDNEQYYVENGIEYGDSETQHIKKENQDFQIFVGANLGAMFPFYEDSDDIYLDNTVMGYGWGFDAGIKFRKDKYIYHPVLKLFFERFANSGTLEYSYLYDFDFDVIHKLYGIVFENYFRIAHNNPSIFGGYNVNDFFTLGIGIGKINSKYEISDINTDITDKGDLFVFNMGYVSQFDNGLGITFDTKYYFPDNDSVNSIISFELGLRYSF